MPARKPIIKPGEAITFDELLDRIPQVDHQTLRGNYIRRIARAYFASRSSNLEWRLHSTNCSTVFRKPIIESGVAITFDELLERIPQADQNLMRDVDATQRGDDTLK